MCVHQHEVPAALFVFHMRCRAGRGAWSGEGWRRALPSWQAARGVGWGRGGRSRAGRGTWGGEGWRRELPSWQWALGVGRGGGG